MCNEIDADGNGDVSMEEFMALFESELNSLQQEVADEVTEDFKVPAPRSAADNRAQRARPKCRGAGHLHPCPGAWGKNESTDPASTARDDDGDAQPSVTPAREPRSSILVGRLHHGIPQLKLQHRWKRAK